jgi:N-acetylneuraminate synthase
MKSSLFDNLFIFEMANNHQGSLSHGKKIIDAMAQIAFKLKINAAVKFQYRQLDSFIHPKFKDDPDIKHINRFQTTKLENYEFKELISYTNENNLISIVTPFDEKSVDYIEEHNVDIIKIASCSSDDWPLLSRISKSNKPIIASTGGLDYDKIDNLYTFFKKRTNKFALLYCVGVYPTPVTDLNLNAIKTYINRYPDIVIGYSGHEDPNNIAVGSLACALGAKIFERHVGVETDDIKLNAYSMNPIQTENWVKSVIESIKALGTDKKFNKSEEDSILSLQRGVYAKCSLKKGQTIMANDVFFAMPALKNQLTSGNFGRLRSNFVASKDYKVNEAIFESSSYDEYHRIRTIIHRAQALLRISKIKVPFNISAEISHHYGLNKFDAFGLFIINILNLEYCKKILIIFPGQSHPEQFHNKKQESFHILSGSLDLFLNGIEKKLNEGDIVTIERGVKHSFFSKDGCIFEEISSTHFRDDSFYSDNVINGLDPLSRKTVIPNFYV